MTPKERKEWQAYLDQCKLIGETTAPPKRETPRQKRRRIKRALSNIETFAKEYFAGFLDSPFGWFHKELFKEIDGRGDDLILCEWPREHGKSVIVDILIPMYLKAKGVLTGMILASSDQEKAKGLLKDLQAQLTSNRRFIHDFGEQKTLGAWTDGHFTTSDGIGFWAFGLGQNPAGVREGNLRPNYGVIDDADDKRKAKNQTRIMEDIDWVLGEFQGCLAIKQSWLVYANNRVHKKGLTAHMAGDVEPGQKVREGVKHIKAFATENPKTRKKLMPEAGGVPCWPERYTVKHIINRMKRMGYRNAMRQFFHHHIEEGTTFTDQMIKWGKPLPYRKYDKLVSYCDPSWKDKSQNDFKAIVLLGKTGIHYHILWAWIRQAKVSDMVAAHYMLAQMVGDVPIRHYIEANATQDSHITSYMLHGDEVGEVMRIKQDKRRKENKVDRIADLEPLFTLGLVVFNDKMKSDPDMDRLIEQFKAFPDGPDDGPDAVEGAIAKLPKAAKRRSNKAIRTGKYSTNSNRSY